MRESEINSPPSCFGNLDESHAHITTEMTGGVTPVVAPRPGQYPATPCIRPQQHRRFNLKWQPRTA